MRRPLIAGNWKMNMDQAGTAELVQSIAKRATEMKTEAEGVDLLVCPPSVYLLTAMEVAAGSSVAVGAQNMSCQPKGAFTGEISAGMLTDIGAQYVILGHSERRHIFGETDENVNKKTLAALAAGLTPIVCVGELLEDREAGRTAEVIRTQFEGSLQGLSAEDIARTVIAYEPVWAIGTGKVASPEQAEEVHADLRNLLTERYNESVAAGIRILYGGSMKPGNAAELISQPNVDGGLIGGASLKADDFLGIAMASVAVAS